MVATLSMHSGRLVKAYWFVRSALHPPEEYALSYYVRQISIPMEGSVITVGCMGTNSFCIGRPSPVEKYSAFPFRCHNDPKTIQFPLATVYHQTTIYFQQEAVTSNITVPLYHIHVHITTIVNRLTPSFSYIYALLPPVLLDSALSLPACNLPALNSEA